jgi:hypothetical protein
MISSTLVAQENSDRSTAPFRVFASAVETNLKEIEIIRKNLLYFLAIGEVWQ